MMVELVDLEREIARRRDCPWRALIEWLETAMSARGLNPAALAQYSGVPLSTLSGLLHCGHKPRLETLERLANYFRQPLAKFKELAGMAVAEPAPSASLLTEVTGVLLVPVVSEVSAGGGLVPDTYAVIAPIRGASRSLVGFRVRGDCMAPRIEHGDTVIVDLDRLWRDGSVVLARFDSELHVKRAYRSNGTVHLKADAAGYPDIAGDDVQVYGVVIRVEKVIE